jgi:predicted transcriptional regulator
MSMGTEPKACSEAFEVDLSSRSLFYIVVGRRAMDLTFPFKRRSSLVISIAILRAAKNGIRKTHLLSSVSLSYEQFIRYIEFLKAHGFIKECDGSYQTTREGLKLIGEFESSSLIRSILAA